VRVAIYDPYLDTMSGGEKYMLSIAECLSREHEVVILWPNDKKDLIVQKAAQRFSVDLSTFVFDSLFDTQISFLQRYKKSRSYDKIIFLSDGSIPVVGCPLIIHWQSPMNWVHGKSLLNRLKLKRVKDVIVNSKYTKSYIDKTFSLKSTILYPPVYIQRTYDQSKKTNTILNVGRFGINNAGSSYKKQDVLAEAFTLLSPMVKDWRLVFVMAVLDKDMKVYEDFKNKYAHLPIDFIINPSNEHLWNMYAKASIYWHASGFGEDLKKYPDRAEHFGISTVEAMGVGAVPLVVNSGGQKEIVEEGVNGYLWDSLEELVSKTQVIIRDSDKRRDLADHAVTRSKDFSIELFEESLKRIIK